MGEAVGIVGLGSIAGAHLEALGLIDGVEVIGGVDINRSRGLTFRGREIPTFASIDDLLNLTPTMVIVATPTATHYEVCMSILSSSDCPPRVFVEKPLAGSSAMVNELMDAAGPDCEVVCIYHAAHAPEVRWASDRIEEWVVSFGPIISFEMKFSDPYSGPDRDTRNRSLVNSWLDSGINALSIALRFVTPQAVTDVTTIDATGSTYRGEVSFHSNGRAGQGSIHTTWNVTTPAKSSQFVFETGVRLQLDHQRVFAHLDRAGESLDTFLYAGTRPRLVTHYDDAFRSLVTQRSGYYGSAETRLLHELLFEYPADSEAPVTPRGQ